VESAGGSHTARALGVIRTPPTAPVARRLASIADQLRALLVEYHPQVVAVERVFFQVNVSTAIGVAQAAGLAMAEGCSAGAEVFEYTPNQVKEAVAGWGAAPKEQMQRMIQALLSLDSPPSPADAADAAAVALCHLAHAPMSPAAVARRGPDSPGRRVVPPTSPRGPRDRAALSSLARGEGRS